MNANDYQLIFFLCLSAVVGWKFWELINTRRNKAIKDFKERNPTIKGPYYPERPRPKNRTEAITPRTTIEVPRTPPYKSSRMQSIFSKSKRIISDLFDNEDEDLTLISYEDRATDKIVTIRLSFNLQSDKRCLQITFNCDDEVISYSIDDSQE